MDLIRSCYIAPMVFEIDTPPVLVRWYRCGPEAKPFPGQHCYGSLNDDDTPGSPLLGEQRGTKIWDAGMRPSALNGNGLIVGAIAEYERGNPLVPRPYVYSVAVEPSLQLCQRYEFPEGDAAFKDFFYKHECGRLRFAEDVCPIIDHGSGNPVLPRCFKVCKELPEIIYAHWPPGQG